MSQLVRKVLDVTDTLSAPRPARSFSLAESRSDMAKKGLDLRRELREDETLVTDFIGASEQDCQKWALEYQDRQSLIYHNMIVIVDARSAKDGSVSFQYYAPKDEDNDEYGDYGTLPPQCGVWYKWRIDPNHADTMRTSLGEGHDEIVYPIYFGRKEALTNEHDIFDTVEAERLMVADDRDLWKFDG